MENLDQAMAEIERLRKDGEKLHGELSGDTFKLAEDEYNVLLPEIFLFKQQEV